MNVKRALAGAAVSGILIVATPAFAQTEPESTPAPSGDQAAAADEAASPAPAAESAQPAPVSAQVPTHTAVPDPETPATGVMVQARMQSQSNLLSLGASPGMLVGYRGDGFGVGLGLGWMRVAASVGEDDTSLTGSIFQAVPTVFADVWRSRDGRARANVALGIGYGRASLTGEGTSEDCVFDPVSGVDECTTSKEEQSVGATLVPVLLGFGGDYFLGRNFALGAEAGIQGAFVVGVDAESGGETEDVDASANYQFAYGVLRATFVLGD